MNNTTTAEVLPNGSVLITVQEGQMGQQGYTPYVGANGNWWINGIDTGNPSLAPLNYIDGGNAFDSFDMDTDGGGALQ